MSYAEAKKKYAKIGEDTGKVLRIFDMLFTRELGLRGGLMTAAALIMTWADTRAAAQTVRDRFDMLLSDGTPPSFSVSNDQVAARTWRQGRKVWVLAVNTTQVAQRAVVRLENGPSLDFALKPLEHKIVEVASARPRRVSLHNKERTGCE